MQMIEDQIGEIPPAWQTLPLGSACEATSVWNPSRQRREQIRYVDVSSVSNESFSITAAQPLAEKDAPSRARKIVKTGDVIYATVRPRLKRVALVPAGLDGEIVSTAFCVVRAERKLAAPHFLYYTLLNSDVNLAIIQHERGASYPAVADKDVLGVSIHLPPLPEQKKIAAVLWKIQQAIEVEAGLARCARDLKKSAMRQLFAVGLRSESLKITQFGEVPESWDIMPLSSCAYVQTGATKGREIPEADALDVPYLRVANVQDGHLDLTEMKTIRIRKSELDGLLLRRDDVVLTEGGDFDKLGRGFIWEGQIEQCVHQNHIFAVRVNREKLVPRYFAYLAQSPYGRAYFLSIAHKTTNLACINTTKLRAFPVLIPQLDEQEEIAEILGTLDQKIAVHDAKQRAWQDLFKTMLHKLMTAQIRVNDLDIDTRELEA